MNQSRDVPTPKFPLPQTVRGLANETRVEILIHLISGPATVARLAQLTGSPQPAVSTHLALLTSIGFLTRRSVGRTRVYSLNGDAVTQLVMALIDVTGGAPKPRLPAPLAIARGCYDHLAGDLGIRILDTLVEERAVEAPPAIPGRLRVFPKAKRVLGRWGISIDELAQPDRVLARACTDWTGEHAHLGGALGAAVYAKFEGEGWIIRQRGSRAVTITPAGKKALNALLHGLPPSTDESGHGGIPGHR